MALNYKPLWIKKSYESWCHKNGGTYHQCYGSNGENKLIIFKNLERICKALECTPNDVISFDDSYGKEENEQS